MHWTTIAQNKIITIICSSLFFCLANIYRPSLGKMQLGRPNPNQFQALNFYFRRKKKSTQNCMHSNVRVKIFLTINMIIINEFVFWKSAVQRCEVFTDFQTIYFTILQWIINAWHSFETLKTKLLGKCILILFLIWKWIKYIFALFVLTICIKNMPGVRSIAMKSIRTTILTS